MAPEIHTKTGERQYREMEDRKKRDGEKEGKNMLKEQKDEQ